MPEHKMCAVCNTKITENHNWVYHARLDAYICSKCPLTNVRGEDVSGHTMYFHWGQV